jgi:hypothetical protein
MSLAPPRFVEQLRQPEYVGENRCVPCTAVNVVIALVGAGVVGAGGVQLASGTVGAAGAGVFLALSLASIYLRGYLVPGTPTLTKRYFPDRVLRWFDKAPEDVDAPVAGSAGEIEAEPMLLDAGAIEPCEGGQDLCATASFTADWNEEIAGLSEDSDLRGRLAELLETDRSSIDVVERETFTMVRSEGQPVARWESRAALLADAGAYPWLSERVDSWADLDLRDRGQLLNGARVFLETCPSCDGPVGFSEDTRESCCREIDVVALECDDCGSLLLEVEV